MLSMESLVVSNIFCQKHTHRAHWGWGCFSVGNKRNLAVVSDIPAGGESVLWIAHMTPYRHELEKGWNPVFLLPHQAILSTRLCCSYAIFLVVHAKWIHMFYLFSILGVNEGENTVLRTEKKKIPGLARGRDFGDWHWKRWLSLTWRRDQPHTGPIRRES